MVVRAKSPTRESARTSAGPVSRAQPNEMPRDAVTSYSREYLDYWSHLSEDEA